jgi:hypothetical protein
MYPKLFYVFDPSDKSKEKNLIKNKIIIKFNQTNEELPIIKKDEIPSRCIII